MSRRRDEPSGAELVFDVFRSVPWFVGPIFAGFVYVLLALGAPWWWPPVKDSDSLNNKKAAEFLLAPFGIMAKICAPYGAGFVLLVWSVAEAWKFVDRRRLDQVQGHDDIRHLDWREFERLLCEAFRRQGYSVEHSGSASADGGIDIRLQKKNEVSLVQCKHWKTWQVGVSIIREMLGLVTSEHAQWGVVVTSGTFTSDAIAFANKNSIQLIAGDELTRLISSVQTAKAASKLPASPPSVKIDPQTCPNCGASMERRTAKRWENAGAPFYGCSKYPACKGTRPV